MQVGLRYGASVVRPQMVHTVLTVWTDSGTAVNGVVGLDTPPFRPPPNDRYGVVTGVVAGGNTAAGLKVAAPIVTDPVAM